MLHQRCGNVAMVVVVVGKESGERAGVRKEKEQEELSQAG